MNKKFIDEFERIKNRDQSNDDFNWIPEKGITDFTFKGFLIVIGLIGIISIFKYLFF